MRTLVRALLFIWQLPQNIIGIIWCLVFRQGKRMSLDSIPKTLGTFRGLSLANLPWWLPRYIYLKKTPAQRIRMAGVCLGQFIQVACPDWEEGQPKDLYLAHRWLSQLGHYLSNLVCHEYGHAYQSVFFGPLYLILVGIPSLTLVCMVRTTHRTRHWYLSKYPEKWADKLGGVSR